MCEYCNVHVNKSIWLKPMLSKQDSGRFLQIDRVNSKYYLTQTVFDESGINKKDFRISEIFYCPMCGRNLQEEDK